MYSNILLKLSDNNIKTLLNNLSKESKEILLNNLLCERKLMKEQLSFSFDVKDRRNNIKLNREYRDLNNREDLSDDEQKRMIELENMKQFDGFLSNNYKIKSKEIISEIQYLYKNIDNLIDALLSSFDTNLNSLLGLTPNEVKSRKKLVYDKFYENVVDNKQYVENELNKVLKINSSKSENLVLDGSRLNISMYRNGIKLNGDFYNNLFNSINHIYVLNKNDIEPVVYGILNNAISLDKIMYNYKEDVDNVREILPTISYVNLEISIKFIRTFLSVISEENLAIDSLALVAMFKIKEEI